MRDDDSPNDASGGEMGLGAIELLGQPLAELLFQSGWMLRRKDTIQLLDDAWVRRTISVDISIPKALGPIAGQGPDLTGSPLYGVPITILPKLPADLMRFDFVDRSSKLVLPTLRQNGLAAYSALLWAASIALGGSVGEVPLPLREELLFVALGPAEYATQVSYLIRAPGNARLPVLPRSDVVPPLGVAEEQLSSWLSSMRAATLLSLEPAERETVSDAELTELHAKLAENEKASWLLQKFGAGSPILAVLPRAPAGAQLVTLAYDEVIHKEADTKGQQYVAEAGWAAYPLAAQTSFVGAASYHLEFVAPDGLEVVDAVLVELEPDADDPEIATLIVGQKSNGSVGDAREGDRSTESSGNSGGASTAVAGDDPLALDEVESARGSRIHLYSRRAEPGVGLAAQISLRVSRDRFVSGAFWTSLGITVTLGTCAGLAQPLVRHETGAQTLLLAFPGVLAAIVAQAAGHPLIVRLLRRARRSLLCSGVSAFLGAGLLALIHTGGRANAGEGVYAFYASLAAVCAWQTGKLWLARKLPRPASDEGSAEWLVARIAHRMQMAAQTLAKLRQRSLRVAVRSSTLSWTEAARLSKESGTLDPMRLDVGSRWRWFKRQPPTLRLSAQPLFLLPDARRSDVRLRQGTDMSRHLARALRWLGEELPGGFEVEVTWIPILRRVRWWIRIAWSGSSDVSNRALAIREHRARHVEELAIDARRGALHVQAAYKVFCVGQPTLAAPPQPSERDPTT